MRSEATLSRLLSETFDVVGANSRLALIYVAIMVPVSVGSEVFVGPGLLRDFVPDMVSGSGATMAAFGFLSISVAVAQFVVGMAAYYWLYAGMMQRTVSPGFGRVLPFIGVYILASIGVIFGLVLLIVPGLILAVRWCVALPLAAGTDTPALDTFGESWAMTTGRGWSIFGAIVVLAVILMVVSSVLGATTSFIGSFGATVIGALSEHVTAVLFAAFAVGAYRLLRDGKDEITEIFE